MIGGPIGWPIGGVIVAEDARSAEAAITLDDLALATTGTLDIAAEATITLGGVSLSFTGALALKGQAAVTLDDATLAATGELPIVASASISLDGIGLSFTGAIAIKAAVAVTLDDIILLAHGGPETTITDTEVLQLPVNCVLAGQQHYKQSGREYEIRPLNLAEKTWGRRSSVRALRGGKPSFTVTTSNRGYD